MLNFPMNTLHQKTAFQEQYYDTEFEQFIRDFSETTLPKIYRLIEKYKSEKNIVIFKSRTDADKYIEMLE